MKFKDKVKRRVVPFILASTIGGSVLVKGAVKVHADTDNEEFKKTVVEDDLLIKSELNEGLTEEQIIVKNSVIETHSQDESNEMKSEQFDTKDEAQDWIDEKKSELEKDNDITKEEIITETTTIETDKSEIDESFETEDDAKERKEELESEENVKTDLKIEEEVKENVTEEKITFGDMVFESEEEKNKYIKSLEDKNNLVINEREVVEKTEHEEELVKEISNEDEAKLDKGVEAEINKIKGEETDDLKYETRVDKTSTTEKVSGEDVLIESSTIKFSTKEEAEESIKQLLASIEGTDYFYNIGNIEEIIDKIIKIKDYSDIPLTQEELEALLKKISDSGYSEPIDVIDKTTSSVVNVPTGNLKVKDFTKYPSKNEYIADGNFAIIKQGNGTVVVWTPDVLTEEEQSKFMNLILEANYDPSISKSSFQYISGTGTYDLSYIGKNWGIYVIEYENNKIKFNCDADKISHLNVGNVEKEYEEKEILNHVYYLLGYKEQYEEESKMYSYDYTKFQNTYLERNIFNASIFKKAIEFSKKYIVNGSYVNTNVEYVPSYRLTGTVLYLEEIQKYRGLIGYNAKKVTPPSKPEEKPEVTPSQPKYNDINDGKDRIPKTSDDSNIELYSAIFLSSTMGLGAAAMYGINQEKAKKKILKK